jgi:hypothetical protein
MKHALLRRLSSPAAFRAGDAPVDLHEPGEKEVPQGCRERPAANATAAGPVPLPSPVHARATDQLSPAAGPAARDKRTV